MEKRNKDYQLLVLKYLENELLPNEREKLEMEIQNNPELMKELQMQTKLNDFLKGKFMAEKAEQESGLIDNLSIIQTGNVSVEKLAENWVNECKLEKEHPENNDELRDFIVGGMKQANELENKNLLSKPIINEKKTDKTTFINKWIYLASSIAAVFIISISLLWYFGTKTNNAELFASYYQPYHFVSEQNRSSDTIIFSSLNEAVEFYESGNYAQASERIEKVLSTDKNQVKAHFISGLILNETGNYSAASTEFNLIIDKFDSYHIESKWYLALCYLKLNQVKKAKQLFNELSLSKNFYQIRAGEILGKIK